MNWQKGLYNEIASTKSTFDATNFWANNGNTVFCNDFWGKFLTKKLTKILCGKNASKTFTIDKKRLIRNSMYSIFSPKCSIKIFEDYKTKTVSVLYSSIFSGWRNWKLTKVIQVLKKVFWKLFILLEIYWCCILIYKFLK